MEKRLADLLARLRAMPHTREINRAIHQAENVERHMQALLKRLDEFDAQYPPTPTKRSRIK